MNNQEYRGKALVITRQIRGLVETVVSAVIVVKDEDVDNPDMNVKSLLESQAKDHIDEFSNKFVEFKSALWATQLADVVN